MLHAQAGSKTHAPAIKQGRQRRVRASQRARAWARDAADNGAATGAIWAQGRSETRKSAEQDRRACAARGLQGPSRGAERDRADAPLIERAGSSSVSAPASASGNASNCQISQKQRRPVLPPATSSRRSQPLRCGLCGMARFWGAPSCHFPPPVFVLQISTATTSWEWLFLAHPRCQEK